MASQQFPTDRRSRSPTERRGNLLCVTNLRSTPVHPEIGKRQQARRRHATGRVAWISTQWIATPAEHAFADAPDLTRGRG